MKYKKTTLSNGLRIITVPMKDTQTATVVVMVGVGSRYEAEKEAGLSHFIEHMFFKGTEKRPTTLDISSELDAIGGDYNAFTGKDMTGYYAKVDYKHLDTALDVVSDIYLNSKIEKEEIEKEKGTIIQEMNMYEDNPMRTVGDVFEELLYEKNPLGRGIVGTKKSVKSFKRGDFLKYMKKFYIADDSVICVAGKFNEKDILDRIKKYFQKMGRGRKPRIKRVTEKQLKPELKIKFKKTDQTHMILGSRAYDYNHKDRFALSLLSVILGGNMSSRMFIEVREKRGLAYYVRTSTEEYADCGYLETQAGVEHKNLEKAVEIILQEYKKITENKASEQELRMAKDYLKGKSVMGLEVSDAVAMFYGEQELMKNRIMSLDDIFEKIEKVTLDDIQRVARDVFQEKKLNLAVIGPHKNGKKLEKILKL